MPHTLAHAIGMMMIRPAHKSTLLHSHGQLWQAATGDIAGLIMLEIHCTVIALNWFGSLEQAASVSRKNGRGLDVVLVNWHLELWIINYFLNLKI